MTKTCCICRKEFTEYGNNPEPFDGKIGTCCDDCNNYFVVPVRLMFGRGGDKAPLVRLREIARVGLPGKFLAELFSLGDGLAKAQTLAREIWKQQAEKAKPADNVIPIQ